MFPDFQIFHCAKRNARAMKNTSKPRIPLSSLAASYPQKPDNRKKNERQSAILCRSFLFHWITAKPGHTLAQ